ncbi:MAG: hypothetical protein U0W40_14930 [Acidimicrobiia bacterium]
MERERLSVVEVLRTTLRVWRAHKVSLWLLAAIVLAPLMVLETAGYHFAVQLSGSKFDPATAIVNLFVILVFEIGSAEVEAVAAEKMVGSDLHGHRLPRFRQFLREVPWVRLVLATLLFEIAVVLGLLLAVVPGVLLVVFCALYGPVIVVERSGVWASFRRSAALVRGNFWRMFVLTMIVVAIGEGVGLLVEALLAGTSRAVEVFGLYLFDVLLTPLQGVGIAVTYFALVAIDRNGTRGGTREEPAGAGPSDAV